MAMIPWPHGAENPNGGLASALTGLTRKDQDFTFKVFTRVWTRLWLRYSGLGTFGRVAARLAMWRIPPFYGRKRLASMSPRGFISPYATIYHKDLQVGVHVFIDDHVMIFQTANGGQILLGDRVSVMRDVIMETRQGGAISIGAGTGIHPRCQIVAALEPIHIGRGVGIAANCAFYSYDHSFDAMEDIFKQKLRSKGGISIGDGAWLGTGVIVLSGVSIGKGAVIGAGSVVTHDIPDDTIAVGVPARVQKMRNQV